MKRLSAMNCKFINEQGSLPSFILLASEEAASGETNDSLWSQGGKLFLNLKPLI